jgi:hypothetical protein
MMIERGYYSLSVSGKIAFARLLFPQMARMDADSSCVTVCVDLRNPREKEGFRSASVPADSTDGRRFLSRHCLR